MVIKNITLENYRNYEKCHVEFDKNLNILTGNNGQGKTNLLEAIGLLMFGKSHRTSKDYELIRLGNKEFRISATIDYNGYNKNIDYYYSDGKKSIFLNGIKTNKYSDLIGNILGIIFSPEDLLVIKGSPSERRRFIDMILCQIYSGYLHNLQIYNNIIMNRNKLLKDIRDNSKLIDTLDIWNEKLADYGSKIIIKRLELINGLQESFQKIHSNFTNHKELVKINYSTYSDIDVKMSSNEIKDVLIKVITKKQDNDIIRCYTSVGPHRDDFSININGIDLKSYGSQGQQRSAILSIKLAIVETIERITDEHPIVLLDDVLSELDNYRKKYILESIEKWQTIITINQDPILTNMMKYKKVFSVVNGTINLM